MPVWTYGIQLWVVPVKAPFKLFKNSKIKLGALSWMYLGMFVTRIFTVIFNYAIAHILRLMNHPNDEAPKLVAEIAADRRLLRIRPLDLSNF